MRDALAFSALLLLPVLALLFVALRLRRRARYPHELLVRVTRTSPADALFRMLRLYADAAFDGACALVIGFALAGLPKSCSASRAVVLDASLSMTAGLVGERPLDRALAELYADQELAGADLYVLGFDEAAGKPRLRDARRERARSPDPVALAARLQAVEAFFTVDYGLLSELPRRGYASVTLLTDTFPMDAVGFSVREYRTVSYRTISLASARRDAAAGVSVACFVATGGAVPAALFRLTADGVRFPVEADAWSIAATPSGFELTVREPGAYAVAWDDRLTPFFAPAAPPAPVARGAFAGRLVAALGTLSGDGPRPLAIVDGGGRSRSGRLGVAEAVDEPYVLSPAATLGAVVAAGYDRSADLALGPAALASPETALAFWAAWQSVPAAEPAPGSLRRVGDGYVYGVDDGVRVLAPPAGEQFSPVRRGALDIGKVPPPRAWTAIVLAVLYGLKVWLAGRSARNPSSRTTS